MNAWRNSMLSEERTEKETRIEEMSHQTQQHVSCWNMFNTHPDHVCKPRSQPSSHRVWASREWLRSCAVLSVSRHGQTRSWPQPSGGTQAKSNQTRPSGSCYQRGTLDKTLQGHYSSSDFTQVHLNPVAGQDGNSARFIIHFDWICNKKKLCMITAGIMYLFRSVWSYLIECHFLYLILSLACHHHVQILITWLNLLVLNVFQMKHFMLSLNN